jgi:hypothetical protein
LKPISIIAAYNPAEHADGLDQQHFGIAELRMKTVPCGGTRSATTRVEYLGCERKNREELPTFLFHFLVDDPSPSFTKKGGIFRLWKTWGTTTFRLLFWVDDQKPSPLLTKTIKLTQ